MCRFIAYRGKAILLDEVLHKPKNSLINQSAQAHEAEEPLNGDGFGVGWYMKELDPEPGIFVSVRPAWNDRNLRYLCQKVSTSCFFAHVRAASAGEVSEANCHPFHFKQFMFMHNGGVGDFQRLKRLIRRKLSDEIYDWIRGQTDSEHLFALVLENLKNREANPTIEDLTLALEMTIREIQQMKKELGMSETCYINCVFSDGNVMVAARYVSDVKEEASTLYYSEGHHYEVKDGVCTLRRGNTDEHAVLIVSEKLTMSRTEWREIPTNFFVVVDAQLKASLREINDGIERPRSAKILKAAEKRGGFKPKRRA
jgi:predicted glutamine amidotransferase